MSNELIITNARIVTADHDFLGCLHVRGKTIVDIDAGSSSLPAAQDWNGDYLLPGLVELHTDNLEKHLMPRPKVRWPEFPALLAHDAEIAAAGITTVFDALGVGDVDEAAMRGQDLGPLLACLDRADADGLLRADHYLHVRCELPAPNVLSLFEPFSSHTRLGLISLMDHTPGQRQWVNMEQARIYYCGKKGWSDSKFDRIAAESKGLQARYAEPHRRHFCELARRRDIPLASHDDTTREHVEEAHAAGIIISEFPTSMEAARTASTLQLGIVMGAPNVVRGGSHSGNVAAMDLAHARLLDVLSSDYVPASLLHAAFMLIGQAGYTVAEAVAIVSANPARLAHLDDRGHIAIGKRADFSRTRVRAGMPTVIAVWREGERVV